MDKRILVINPNSNEAVTRDIDQAMAPLRLAGGPAIDCVTLTEGPPGIESQVHVDTVVAPLLRLAEREAPRSAALVIACFSDPGLYSLREALAQPVFGIAQCGFSAALAAGDRFGIISILGRSIARHLRYVTSLGLASRLAGDRAIDMRVAELQQAELVAQRLLDVGELLRRQDGADVIVLGCAGMTRHRGELEVRLGLPVIDPTQAAAAHALLTLQVAAARPALAHTGS